MIGRTGAQAAALMGAMVGVIGAGVTGAVASVEAQAKVDGACARDVIDLRGDWGRARFRVAVADTPESQARGLMFVEDLPSSEGMLFAYDAPRAVSFWMRNTLVPLDMLFLSPDGVVTRVHENAVPGDETPIPGGDGVQYVLEINGGLASRLGIEPGDEARHPRIGADAAWPCEDAAGG